MPQLPNIGRQVQADPTSDPFIRSVDSGAGAIKGFASALSRIGQTIESEQNANEDALIAKRMSEFRQKKHQDYTAGLNEPDAETNFAKNYFVGYQADAAALKEEFAESPRAQAILEREIAKHGERAAMRAETDQNRMNIDFQVRSTTQGIVTDAATIGMDETVYADTLADTNARIDAMEIPPANREALKANAKAKYAQSAVQGFIQRQPIEFSEAAKGLPTFEVTEDSAPELKIKMTPVASAADAAVFRERIFKREGGFVDDPADRGGATNFGVTEKVARANGYTGDMRDMPKEFAAKFYEKLWNEGGYGKLPPHQAEMKFDMAVNHGLKNAEKILARSDGTPESIHAHREAFYRAIVRNNPSQKKFLKGWLRRNDDVLNDVKEKAPTTVEILASAGENSPQWKQVQKQMPASVRKAMEALPFDQQLSLIAQGEAAANRKRKLAKAEIGDNVANAAAVALDSDESPSLMAPEKYAEAYGADAPAAYREHNLVIQQVQEKRALAGMSASERRNARLRLSPIQGDPDATIKGKLRGEHDTAVKAVTKAWAKNPVVMATQHAGIETLQPDQEAQDPLFSIGRKALDRATALNAVYDEQELPASNRPLLSKDEQQMMADMVFGDDVPADQAAGFIQGLSARPGPEAYKLINEIAKDKPVLKRAALIAHGQARNFTENFGIFNQDPEALSGDKVLRYALEGARVSKDANGNFKNVKPYKIADATKAFNEYVGDSFRGAAGGAGSAMETVLAVYTGMRNEVGKLTDQELDPDMLNKAMRAVIGPVEEFGGRKTQMPRGWDPAQARTRMRQHVAEQFAGSGRMALSDYTLDAIGDGIYVVESGTTPLLVDGQPMTINIYDPLKADEEAAGEADTVEPGDDAAELGRFSVRYR